jgi:membrane protease YdiL (CAAX protease family)
MEKERVVWFRWQPTPTMCWLVASLLAGGVALWGLARLLGGATIGILILALNAFFALAASYFTISRRGRSLETIGVTERNWPQAMGVGAVLGLLLGATQLFRDLGAGGALVTPRIGPELAAFTFSLTLIVAGEEILFRGWLQSCLESALGVAPAVVVSAFAYTLFPIAFLAGDATWYGGVQTPLGFIGTPAIDLPILFVVALFLSVICRFTGSLWSSGSANFVGRFALAFVAMPQQPAPIAPGLSMAVTLALWALVALTMRGWLQKPSERRPSSRI